MTTPNFYQILGVAPTASTAEMRAAYTRLVKLHHPDIVGDLPGRLQEVQQAYRCLADVDARARHDRMIADHERQHADRQRRIQRRLRHYDLRHPASSAPPPRRRRWLPLLALLAAAFALAGLTFGLFG